MGHTKSTWMFNLLKCSCKSDKKSQQHFVKQLFQECIEWIYWYFWLINSQPNHLKLCNLFMKEGNLFVLFCFVPMRSIELGCFTSRSCSLWKTLKEEGCINLVFHGILTCGVEVLEYRMTSSLKNKLNCSWKFKINSKTPGFGRKNQLRTWWHLGQWAQANLLVYFISR
jgi:hypothetical protein